MEEFKDKVLGIKRSFEWAIETKKEKGLDTELEEKCLEECEVVDLYTAFLSNRQKAFEYASKQTEKISKDLFVSETEDVGSVCAVIMQISCVANVFKILTDKILYIKEDEPEQEKAEK